MTQPSPPVDLRLRGSTDEKTTRLALRAVLSAAHLLGLATGVHLRSLRGLKDPLADLQARLDVAELRARLAFEMIEILVARFARIEERHRPYCTPAQRFRILETKNLLGWSARETARVALVCVNTILNWERAADPASQTVGVKVQTTPPIVRYDDCVAATAQALARLGAGGQDMIARVLARAGWKISSRSVGRFLRRKKRPTPPPTTTPDSGPKTTHPVIARFVHHTWMMDVTLVKQLLGQDLYVAAVFDAFSRVPLVLSASQRKPGAADMARLLRRAAGALLHPKYVITDLGGEFTGKAFRNAVSRIGARQRFASADSIRATARLERFWRTLKETARLYRLFLPLTIGDLEERLALALHHYLLFRPHEGLGGATPAEVFRGLDPAHQRAVRPPRDRPGATGAVLPFRVALCDPKNARFPILVAA